MATSIKWTSADLEAMPDNGNLYEIIDGELCMSRQPHYYHQFVCGKLFARLQVWSESEGEGEANLAPGVIFAEDDDVAPDVIWISNSRLDGALGKDGKLHAAPELVVEVLSPGEPNERRDHEVKLKLYSRRGVQEYWIVDWRTKQIAVYRREQARLKLTATLFEADVLDTPLLHGFSMKLADLFKGIRLEI